MIKNGVLLSPRTAQRISNVTRRIEGTPYDRTRKNRKTQQSRSYASDIKTSFKVVKKDSTTIQIYNEFESNSYDSATNAGITLINNKEFTKTKEEKTITQTSFVYLETTETNGLIDDTTIEVATTVNYENEISKIPVALITFTSGEITNVEQLDYNYKWVGQIYTESLSL